MCLLTHKGEGWRERRRPRPWPWPREVQGESAGNEAGGKSRFHRLAIQTAGARGVCLIARFAWPAQSSDALSRGVGLGVVTCWVLSRAAMKRARGCGDMSAQRARCSCKAKEVSCVFITVTEMFISYRQKPSFQFFGYVIHRITLGHYWCGKLKS